VRAREPPGVQDAEVTDEGLEVLAVAGGHDHRVGAQPRAVGQHDLVALEARRALDGDHRSALDRADDADVLDGDGAGEDLGVEAA